ncbi:uncharacterized protein LOC121377635 [Gigantopelta aegis]|uniref:uncharacterized protein LOC121377635 n=1 Tax=Gigantopelta aegis TaxID=1735272 RepID=UPI001B88E0FA|nr:uncharacterized protein LOC121377635 [Gigantopelta aegis]
MPAPRKRKPDSNEKPSSDNTETVDEKSPTRKQDKKTVTDQKTHPGFCRRCLSFGKYVLLLLIVPPFLNYASLQREAQQLLPSGGELYDIGWSQKLFMMCHGKGPPTVILDSPTGMSSDVWALIWPKISQHAKVCVYDRAGIGFSERPHKNSSESYGEMVDKRWQPFTAEKMADDLFHLFTVSSQQEKPFILVGAELGALVAQFYTNIYESHVFGLVLINPLTEEIFDQDQGVWTQYWFGQLVPTFQSFQLGAALGLTRLALLFGLIKQPLAMVAVAPDVHNRQKYLMCNPRHLSSVVDEHHFINETFSQMRTMRTLRSLPSNISVTLVTGNYYDEQMPSSLNKAWAKSERSLISKYLPGSQHIVINGADHHMLYKKPLAVTEPIIKMIKLWKQKNKYSKKS